MPANDGDEVRVTRDELDGLLAAQARLAEQIAALSAQQAEMAALLETIRLRAAPVSPPPPPPPIVIPTPRYVPPDCSPATLDVNGLADAVIDLSRFRVVADYDQLKAGGIAAIIHKASERTTFSDPRYARARDLALENGLLWGAYHFGSGDDPAAQVEHFLRVIQVDGELDAQTLVALDWETTYIKETSQMKIEQAEGFVEAFAQRTGRLPVLYTRANFVRRQLPAQRETILTRCPLWIASWTRTPILHEAWKTFYLWQYTDGGPDPAKSGPLTRPTPGIAFVQDYGQSCDRNFFHGTLEQLRLWWAS